MDNNSAQMVAPSDGVAPHLLYLDKLKKLRAQAGLERGGSATGSTSSITSSSSGIGTAASGSVYRYRIKLFRVKTRLKKTEYHSVP